MAKGVRGAMTRLPRACLICGAVALPGSSRCRDHAGSSGWVKRPSVGTTRGYYGSAWQELRKAIFSERGHVCAVLGCTNYGGTIDHIVPIAAGGAVYDRANLQVLCRQHHDQKTGREGGKKRRSVAGREENVP